MTEENEAFNICCKCRTIDSTEEHTCPYKTEIHDDFETMCNCCTDCTRECADDV